MAIRGGAILIGIVLLGWGQAASARQQSVGPPGQIDEAALHLLGQVQARMRSIHTLSAVFTHTTRRVTGVSPTGTEVAERTTRLRLMRPNFTRIDEELRSLKQGETRWSRAAHFQTEASDGRQAWTIRAGEKPISAGTASKDGHNLSLGNVKPIYGFFDPDEFITAHIDLLRREGLLRRLTLDSDGSEKKQGLRRIQMVYQHVRSEVVETDTIYIGDDLLIHRIDTSSTPGELETTGVLSQIRIDAPMDAASFAFHPPATSKPPKETASDEDFTPAIKKGMSAPDFTVQDAQGNPIKLSDFRGKWVVLDFWATWCGPCVSSFPGLNALVAAKQDKNLVSLAVCVGDNRTTFEAWLAQHKEYSSIRFAIDPAGVGGKGIEKTPYGVPALPTQFVIDPEGRVQAFFVGYGPNSEKQLAEALP